MKTIDEVTERAQHLMKDETEINKVRLPALKEVMLHVTQSEKHSPGYTKHSDHSKSSTKGCVMGCVGG